MLKGRVWGCGLTKNLASTYLTTRRPNPPTNLSDHTNERIVSIKLDVAQASTLPMQDVKRLTMGACSTRGLPLFRWIHPFTSRCLGITLTTQLFLYTLDLVMQGTPTCLPSTCVSLGIWMEVGEGSCSIWDRVMAELCEFLSAGLWLSPSPFCGWNHSFRL